MSRPFEVRGVVEGFYGEPWTPDARSDVLDFVAARGMNAYVYAPKDDPLHRARWREPYQRNQIDALLATAGLGAAQGIRFAYAIAPGLDMDYDSPAERDALRAKVSPFLNGGVDWLVLAFDDVPLRDGSGAGQGEVLAWLADQAPDVRLSVVPTDYVGSRPSRYLDDLCSRLPEAVDVMWTGVTVVSPTITVAAAKDRRAATHDHPLLIWDNYPVNDAFMAPSLHLGPIRGREPGLADVCSGLLANPMPAARASLVALATVANYAADPDAYEPAQSWARAIDDVGGDHAAALATLAKACASSLLDRRVPLHDLLDAWEADDLAAGPSADAVHDELEAAVALPGGLPPVLVNEVEPWADQASREASAGLAAFRCLVDRPSEGDADPWSSVLSAMGSLVMWNGARWASDRVTFGPRFACYPGIVVDAAGALRVDPDLSLVEDANAIDRLCRLALRGKEGRGA